MAKANPKDGEFDGTSSVTWSSMSTARPATLRATLRSNGNRNNVVGKHQPVPDAYPYTFTAKLGYRATGTADEETR